ncbi:Hpt domain-containing protein [Sphingobacterium paucimobilis]|uniref:HPt domain-containing protein n=1 Tax=Sphingobacterium paucimobilis HER1398 TaxID=1346330 RepID=U2J6D7_9SPHI|nr:Hpt domain-containing protein [Sphingobacterium paucimobilis]ERJ60484.1 hypothetical protein M472_17175 [Sphingobacterium paucimobilis HER1398]
MPYKIINPDIIKKSMMGNPSLVKQFVEMYLEQSPIDFQALLSGMNNGDKKVIRDSAHHIKPTMQYIGASTLSTAFQELENMGRDELEMDIINTKFQELKLNFELMLEELRSFIIENDKDIK